MSHSPDTDKPVDLYCPLKHGVSVSCINLWLVDRSACGIRYIENWQESESWRYETAFGKLVQAGIEGFIKSGSHSGMKRFIQTEYMKQVSEFGSSSDMVWWAQLALFLTERFILHYKDDPVLALTELTDSERNIFQRIPLPSGREITLNCYLDGEFPNGMFENKVRGRFDREKISANIKHDLQYNWYLFAMLQETGVLPERVWYQHILRPGSFGYRGPKQKKSESRKEYLERIKEHIKEYPEIYFYRYLGFPTIKEINRWAHATFYPLMEAFLDWHEFMTNPPLGGVNKYNWVAPYGTYNPFEFDSQEAYRNFRLTGSTAGLRKRTK